MDLRKIRKLIEIFHASKLGEIEIREGEESIRMTRAAPAAPETVIVNPVPSHGVPAPELQDIVIDDDAPPEGQLITSPMVGTFYCAASPSDDPLVSVGDKVEIGQVLCLIEAMKIFNQIEADRSGVVQKILKQDHDPVEFGETLFILGE